MLKGKKSAGATKARQHEERELYHQNTFFATHQKQFYQERDGRSNIPNKAPDAQEVSDFCRNLWLVLEILTKMLHGSQGKRKVELN